MEKIVLVTIEDKYFEICFQSDDDAWDVHRLKLAIAERTKSCPLLQSLMKNKTVAFFESESKVFPGKWVVVEVTSFLENLAELRCTLSERSAAAPPSPPQSYMSDASTIKNTLIKEEIMLPDSEPEEEAARNTGASNAPTIKRTLIKDEIVLLDSEPEEEGQGDEPQNIYALPSAQGFLNVREDLQLHPDLPPNYEIPKLFGTAPGMAEMLEGKLPLSRTARLVVLRAVVKSEIKITYSPSPKRVTEIARKLINTIPALAKDRTDFEESVRALKCTLANHFSRERKRAGISAARRRRPAAET